MEEEKITEETAQEEQVDLSSEEARRQFITKLVGAAGAVLAAGLISGSADQAEAQVSAQPTVQRKVGAISPIRGTQVSFETLENGIGLRLSGTQLAETLKREGLIPKASAMDHGKVMGIKLEWS